MMEEIKEGQSKVQITKLTEDKIVTTEYEKKNGRLYGRAKIRKLKRR